ncbi:MAG: hypothetical protein JXA93_21910 [Anaerolineae bacterium]|nr:hypothetical protein [Anaerolineae bacterium]
MDDPFFEDEWFWDDEEEDEYDYDWFELVEELADLFFLSDNDYLPDDPDNYEITYIDADDWWPLVDQLTDQLDLVLLLHHARELEPLLSLAGLPTELLEDPITFLTSVLDGHLPHEPSGRRVGSRKLVKIARLVLAIMDDLPETAQAAMRTWAGIQRHKVLSDLDSEFDAEDLADLLMVPDMPPAMTGFSMMIALTLMHWPERAEGLPLPAEFRDPGVYDDVMEQWESLPDNPQVTEEGDGEAEALFAQGRLAHMLAQMGAIELMSPDDGMESDDISLAYSRLSRAILWIHSQCRSCPEREGVTCQVAANWPERPVPLLDVAGEVANTGRIGGCIKM